MEAMIVESATAAAPLQGELRSGDRGVVVPFDQGALVAVIDGLGHGLLACEAAVVAEQVLVESPAAPVDELMRRCHHKLRNTRGAVMSLASFNGTRSTMTWLGVGNVEGFLVRGENAVKAEAIAMRGG